MPNLFVRSHCRSFMPIHCYSMAALYVPSVESIHLLVSIQLENWKLGFHILVTQVLQWQSSVQNLVSTYQVKSWIFQYDRIQNYELDLHIYFQKLYIFKNFTIQMSYHLPLLYWKIAWSLDLVKEKFPILSDTVKITLKRERTFSISKIKLHPYVRLIRYVSI